MRNWHPRVARSVLGATAAFLLAIGLAQVSLPSPAAAIDPCSASPYCYTLTVTLSGDGTGSFQTTNGFNGVPDGFIDCQRAAGTTFGICSHAYYVGINLPRITIYDRITPAAGSDLCQRTGGCAPAGTPDIVTMIANWTESQWSFALIDPEALKLSKSGSGTGTVVSRPAGINCGATCFAVIAYGIDMGLTATAGAGSTFAGWSGVCAGQGSTCFFQITSTTSTDAKFQLVATPTPTPKPTPTRAPTLTKAPTPSPTKAPTPTPKATVGPTAGASLIAAASATDARLSTTPDAPQAAISGSPEPAASGIASPLQSVFGATDTTSSDPKLPGGAGSSGSDSTPTAIGIGVAGVAIAFGLGFLGYEVRRRRLRS